MRPDQFKRLAQLEEVFIDVLIDESGRLIENISQDPGLNDKELRSERFMLKTHASATAKLVANFQKLQENTRAALGRLPFSEREMDGEIKSAEAKAQEVLARAMERRPIKARGAN